MPKKLTPMAIAYDFDGTLAPGNIQENSFIPAIGMMKAAFWKQNKARAEKHEADEILSYMTLMLERAATADVPVRRKDFAKHGQSVKLFPGAAEWFEHVNAYAKWRNVSLQHFIISSGIKEMIEATEIGKQIHEGVRFIVCLRCKWRSQMACTRDQLHHQDSISFPHQ